MDPQAIVVMSSFDIDTRELDRVHGINTDENPADYGCHLVVARVTTAVPADLVLSPSDWPDNQVEQWPRLDQWRAKLPTWFVLACGPEQTHEEVDAYWERIDALPEAARRIVEFHTPMPLKDWVRAFESYRPWFWWAARVTGEHTLELQHAVASTPYTRATLEWMLVAAGASDIEFV